MRLRAIACEVLARQVYYVAALSPHVVDIVLVAKGLHNEPDNLRLELQRLIDETDPDTYDALALGFGLCSNAIAGLVCRHTQMVIPRAHDCITLYLGSGARYGEQFRQHPGTYWYAPDYMERNSGSSDRISLGSADDAGMDETYREYVAKYGKDNADYLMEVMEAWKAHYSRAAYIHTAEMPMPDYAGEVRDLAARRGWDFERLSGSLILLRDLLEGRWDDDRFLVLPPGNVILPAHDQRIICSAS